MMTAMTKAPSPLRRAIAPLVTLLVLLVVQAALWYHTGNIAQAGAARGAAAGAPATATAGVAVSAATQTVLENGGQITSAPVVDLGDRIVMVTVELVVPHVVPFFPSTVTRVQLEPRERRSDAEVDALAERDVVSGVRAVEVERVGLIETLRVSPGRGDPEQQLGPLG